MANGEWRATLRFEPTLHSYTAVKGRKSLALATRPPDARPPDQTTYRQRNLSKKEEG